MTARRPSRPAKLRRQRSETPSRAEERSGAASVKVTKSARSKPARRDRSRPAAAARAPHREPETKDTQTQREAARQRKLIRVAVACVAVIICVFGIAQPLHRWWQQQREYSSISSQVEAAQKTNAELREQRDRWSDKDYIASQARARLQMVMPGETQYTVVDPGPDNQPSALAAQPAHPQGPPRPWYLVVADSVQAASDPDPIDVLKPSVTPTKEPEE